METEQHVPIAGVEKQSRKAWGRGWGEADDWPVLDFPAANMELMGASFW
jgi:hypothetical protein